MPCRRQRSSEGRRCASSTGSNTAITEIGIAPVGSNLVATINWTPTAAGSRTVIAEQLNFSGGVYSVIGSVEVPVS